MMRIVSLNACKRLSERQHGMSTIILGNCESQASMGEKRKGNLSRRGS
jgi:hypothetical protein